MAYQWIELSDFSGGRNAVDDPLSIGKNQVVQMRNGDSWRTRLFRKRGGATAPSIGSTFTGVISTLLSHFPSNNPAAAELWGIDDASTPVIGRMAAASTFSAPTLKDNPASGSGVKFRGSSFNGKLFLAYDTAQDRMHVYDPTLAAPSVRRMGLNTSAAPTAADDGGSGSYAAVLRYYRQRYRIKNGSVVVAQSEPSTSISFTPNGNDTGVTVTKGTALSESETHWVIEGSTDNSTFYELAEVVVGTTTYLDQEAPATDYPQNDLSPVLGSYEEPTSWKYVIVAFNRVFGMGSHETGGKQSRVWYTPATGTADKGDDERIPNTVDVKNWFDVDEGVGGDGTGFAGPIYGVVYLFKYNTIKQFQPTGGDDPVFDVVELSNTRGAIDQECICVGEDAKGQPCVFYMDPQVGPSMVGPTAPITIGDKGIRDLWDGVNLAATTRVGWVCDYPAKGQVWFCWASGSDNEPSVLAVYTKSTGAWSVFDTGGKIRLSRTAVLFARTLGATMSRDKVPYVGYNSSNNVMHRCDTSGTDDAGTTYQAVVKSRPITMNGKLFRATTPWILAKAASGVTLTVTADRDFGKETRSTTIDLTPTADEASSTRVWRRAEGLDVTDCTFLQYQVGDASAVSNTWQIELMRVPVEAMDTNP